jgi:hypothetical protein
MGSGISLPALAIKPPQEPDLLGQVAKMRQIQGMGQEQQLRGQQIQAGQLENEQRVQQIRDQKATTQAMMSWDPSAGYTALAHSVLHNGGSAAAATAIQQHGLEVQKTASDIAKADEETGSKHLENLAKRHDMLLGSLNAVIGGPDEGLGQRLAAATQQAQQDQLIDPQHAQQITQYAQLPPNQLRPALAVLEKSLLGEKEQFDRAMKERQQTASEWKEAGPGTLMNVQTGETKQGNLPVDQQAFNDYMRRVKGATPAGYPAYKAQQEAAATQPYKIQTAQAEAKAHQLIQGMEKPVYAMKPDGSKELMSATDALQAGFRTMLPVGAKEVGDDTQLINRLGDVRQKLTRYEQAMSNLGATVSAKDQGNIAALIGKGAFKAGAFGTELPLDRLNATLQRENIANLSADAKKLLVAYYNARESMQGYQRVLSGTGRANEKAMELNLDALPNPAISDKGYAQESLKQFRENLDIVGQGLPKIPGIKSPEEIEAQTSGRGSPRKDDPLGIR